MNEQKMREALEFYAEAKRYHGPNQKHDGGDKWSLDMTYILDVTRDGGAIAREALAATAGEQVELTDAEIRAEWQRLGGPEKWLVDFGFQQFARAVIAKYEAKRNGATK